MLTFIERLPPGEQSEDVLPLPYDLRQRSRQRVCLTSGREAAVLLAHGTVLRDGDRLRSEDGLIVRVRAAAEPVSTAHCGDALQLARACYHLGNRHVALQIGDGWVRYLRDHVLDDMVRALGLQIQAEEVPFEPEGGAYPVHRHEH